MIDKTISHYKIIEKLGEGGMGVVYKAEDTKLKRTVALKFLPTHLSASEQDKARFIQEAQAASAINHPNICTIHSIDEHENQMFIAMEFIDGQALRDKSQSSAPSLKSAIDIGVQIAEGLAAAHEKGIVHRDVKPENIMVRKDGIVQIMDFGLAKLRGVSRLTKEGSTVGTAGYMSPEQVQGQDADHRSDIFSLGALLYEMFAGQLPFKGVHETALMYEIVNVDAAPMTSVKPDIDQELERIVLECLEKDPNERTQSAKQVAIDLKRARRESGKQRVSKIVPAQTLPQAGPGSAPLQRIRRGFVLPAVIVALIVLLALSLWRPWRDPNPLNVPVTRFTIQLPEDALLGGGFTTMSLSPDGKFLAYSTFTAGITDVRLYHMGNMSVKGIPGTEGATGLVFSPDGNWIAYDAIGRIRKVSLFGGAAEEVCETAGSARGLYWATDGFIYFGHISKGIHRVSENGGMPEVVSTIDSAAGEISHRTPEYLADENTLIYTVKLNNISTFDEALIVSERLDTRERKTLIRGGAHARTLPPNGYLIYARSTGMFGVPFDKSKMEVLSPPTKLFEGGWLNPYSGDANFSIIGNGTLAYVPLASKTFDIATLGLMDRSGKSTQIDESSRPFFYGSISPDGIKVATTIQAANDDIWIYHSVRKTLTRLTFGGGNHGQPIWTNDGKHVIYAAERGRTMNLFMRSWDGSGKEERITTSEKHQLASSVSPDGKHIAVEQEGDIWIHPVDGGKESYPFIVEPSDEISPKFSPDGNYIAYASNKSGRYEVYVVPFPGKNGKWQVSDGGGISPLWSHSGKELFYMALGQYQRNMRGVGETRLGALMVVPVTVSSTFDFVSPRKLCDLPPFVLPPTDISPDDRHFLLVQGRGSLQASEIRVVINWFDELDETFRTRRDVNPQ